MKRMKRETDKRVTVRFVKFKFYLVLVIEFLVVSSSFLMVYYSMPGEELVDEVGRILALVGLILFFCGVFIAGIGLTYKHFIVKPIEELSVAAKKVANGDFSVRVQPIIRKDGKQDVYALLFDDFNTMTAELANMEIMKQDFVFNVSHELKTPLAVIQNFSTILQSDGLTEGERKEYAGKIGEATKRLSVLVTNILQLSRLENQKIVANKQSYNLSEQLSKCLIGFERIWEEKNIEINTELDQNIEVYSDENLLDIVWNNLLSNALKFTPENGTVNITAKTENGCASVSVEDSGCGINETDMQHIYDKFYQADSSHTTAGNGLGLALVHKIVDLINGEISAESEPGKGSRFTVKIKLE